MLKARSNHVLRILQEWDDTKKNPTILGGLPYGHLPIKETRRIVRIFGIQESLVDKYASELHNPSFDEAIAKKLKSLPYPPNSASGDRLIYATAWLAIACLAQYLAPSIDGKGYKRDLQSRYERTRKSLSKHLTSIDKTISSLRNPLVRHAIYNGLLKEMGSREEDINKLFHLARMAKEMRHANLLTSKPLEISDKTFSRRKDTFVRDASITALVETWFLCFGECPTIYANDAPFLKSLRLFLNYTKVSHLGEDDLPPYFSPDAGRVMPGL